MNEIESPAGAPRDEPVAQPPSPLRRMRQGIKDFGIDVFGQKGPPFFIETAGFRRDSGPHATIHRAYNRVAFAYARTPGTGWRFFVKVLAYPLVWLVRTVRIMALHSAETQRRSGKGRLRQLWEIVSLSITHSNPPESYYLFRLFLEEPRQHARLFIHRFETKLEYSLFRLLNRNFGDESALFLLGNKEAFANRCREHDLPTPELLLEADNGTLIPHAWDRAGLPRVDLIVKRRKGKGGRLMTRWEAQEDGSYVSNTGERLDAEGVLDDLKRKSRSSAQIVIPADAEPPRHSVLRGAGGQDPDHLPPGHGPQRIRRSRDRVVHVQDRGRSDGGRQCALRGAREPGRRPHRYPRTGHLDGAPRHAGRHPSPERRTHHRGSPPMWDDVLALVKGAQNAFPEAVFIGWDVGLTPDGPVLIEGNSGTCVHLQQTPHGEPLGAGRFAEIMAYHLERIAPSNFGPVVSGTSSRSRPQDAKRLNRLKKS